jgi:hypothetical protein
VTRAVLLCSGAAIFGLVSAADARPQAGAARSGLSYDQLYGLSCRSMTECTVVGSGAGGPLERLELVRRADSQSAERARRPCRGVVRLERALHGGRRRRV